MLLPSGHRLLVSHAHGRPSRPRFSQVVALLAARACSAFSRKAAGSAIVGQAAELIYPRCQRLYLSLRVQLPCTLRRQRQFSLTRHQGNILGWWGRRCGRCGFRRQKACKIDLARPGRNSTSRLPWRPRANSRPCAPSLTSEYPRRPLTKLPCHLLSYVDAHPSFAVLRSSCPR